MTTMKKNNNKTDRTTQKTTRPTKPPRPLLPGRDPPQDQGRPLSQGQVLAPVQIRRQQCPKSGMDRGPDPPLPLVRRGLKGNQALVDRHRLPDPDLGTGEIYRSAIVGGMER
ncbi:hypothetical protein JTE90_021774 [Oedothorax gibbosus]|uniref:Uncharacterized protein n=1 Tax=Oedothorax gibbosus TaxID=931172 RepID=A0AAV6TGH3_9ARAC|nr:hypothetical protein JTE90_021774 [Oedothorax gibbosus]